LSAIVIRLALLQTQFTKIVRKTAGMYTCAIDKAGNNGG